MATIQERWADDDKAGALGTLPASQCLACKRKRALGCDAFPAGIPRKLFDNVVMHTKPYPGDNGIRYEPATPAEEAEP